MGSCVKKILHEGLDINVDGEFEVDRAHWTAAPRPGMATQNGAYQISAKISEGESACLGGRKALYTVGEPEIVSVPRHGKSWS